MSDVVGYRVAIQEQRAAALQERVQQLLAPFDGTERALDSGCGTGALAFALAPFVERVVGVDLSAELVAAGNERAPANCELIVGDCDGAAVRVRVVRHRRLHARPPSRAPPRARRLRARPRDPARRHGSSSSTSSASSTRSSRPRPTGSRRRATRRTPGCCPIRTSAPARRQRPRRADERDRARAARPRALSRSRRPRRATSGGACADGAGRRLRGRDRLVRRAQARRARRRPSAWLAASSG